MKILLLSQSEVLADFLRNDGQILLQTMDKIDENFVLKEGIDFIVSYGYRYIVSGEILRHFPKRAVNLHISLLPYNKGADPNFWSFVEDTPKGVSIHYMDSGLDTGEIIAQKEVKFDIQNETFASSYNVLQATIQRLFMDVWSDIKSLRANSHAQNGGGGRSYHKSAQKEKYMHLLDKGWDTNIAEFLAAKAKFEKSLV